MTDPHAAETLREMLTAERGLSFSFTDNECAALDTALQAMGIVERQRVALERIEKHARVVFANDGWVDRHAVNLAEEVLAAVEAARGVTAHE